MKMAHKPTLPRMKKNPSRVTMLGASHSGKNSTKVFHYSKNKRLLALYLLS